MKMKTGVVYKQLSKKGKPTVCLLPFSNGQFGPLACLEEEICKCCKKKVIEPGAAKRIYQMVCLVGDMSLIPKKSAEKFLSIEDKAISSMDQETWLYFRKSVIKFGMLTAYGTVYSIENDGMRVEISDDFLCPVLPMLSVTVSSKAHNRAQIKVRMHESDGNAPAALEYEENRRLSVKVYPGTLGDFLKQLDSQAQLTGQFQATRLKEALDEIHSNINRNLQHVSRYGELELEATTAF